MLFSCFRVKGFLLFQLYMYSGSTIWLLYTEMFTLLDKNNNNKGNTNVWVTQIGDTKGLKNINELIENKTLLKFEILEFLIFC